MCINGNYKFKFTITVFSTYIFFLCYIFMLLQLLIINCTISFNSDDDSSCGETCVKKSAIKLFALDYSCLASTI